MNGKNLGTRLTLTRHRFKKDGSPYPEQPLLKRYAERRQHSPRSIIDTGFSLQDAISELINAGALRSTLRSDIPDMIRSILDRYKMPMFYPPGSSQYADAMAAARFAEVKAAFVAPTAA